MRRTGPGSSGCGRACAPPPTISRRCGRRTRIAANRAGAQPPALRPAAALDQPRRLFGPPGLFLLGRFLGADRAQGRRLARRPRSAGPEEARLLAARAARVPRRHPRLARGGARGPWHRLHPRRRRPRRFRRDLDHDRAVACRASSIACPPDALAATFERYWTRVRRSAATAAGSGRPIRPTNGATSAPSSGSAGASGRPTLFDFFMADRRPAAWNQWAEVVGREPREPRFIGDMPHGWVASDYINALLDMLAYERPSDGALVLAAGIPDAWLAGEGHRGRAPAHALRRASATALRAEGDRLRLDLPARGPRRRRAGWCSALATGRRLAGPGSGETEMILPRRHSLQPPLQPRRSPQSMTDYSVSRRLPVGQRDLRLSDRGLAARRRRRDRASGSASPHARHDRERRHRRHRLRPLHRYREDVALMASLGLQGLSLQHRLGARASRRHWHGQCGRPRFLRPAGRRAARRGDRAAAHPLSLGSAGRARRSRRLAQSRHRRTGSPIMARSCSASSTGG